MADAPIGFCTWPGIDQVIEAQFTLCQGVRPSVCTLEIAPQVGAVAIEGVLTFQYADEIIEFPGCRVDQASFTYGPSGLLWRLSIWDRRWRWRFGWIARSSNERHDDVPAAGSPALVPNAGVPPIVIPTIDGWSVESARKMASKLLDALGEKGYDVSAMPDNVYPEAFWIYDNPAQQLGQLAESVGCRVALGVDNIVRVVRTGAGAILPAGAILQTSDVASPPVVPEAVLFVGGKTRYQTNFILEPVGEDTDGTIKPIDQLSYTPASGWRDWQSIDPPSASGFSSQNVAGWETDPRSLQALGIKGNLGLQMQLGYVNPRELARRTVWRWYRIKMFGLEDFAAGKQQSQGVVVPNRPGDPIKYLWQILPIEDVCVEGYYDELRIFRPRPARVGGTFFELNPLVLDADGDPLQGLDGCIVGPGAKNSNPGQEYYRSFTIDKERGIVVFDDQVYMVDPNPPEPTLGRPLPAQLFLRCAFSVQDFATGAFDRGALKRSLPAGSPGSGAMVIRRDEVVANIIPDIDDATGAVRKVVTNQSDCDKQANYAIDAALLEIQQRESADATYVGLLPVSPDGAIWQVSWSVGPAGATTRVARNSEWDRKPPTYKERRMYEKSSWNDKLVQQLIQQARRERG